VYKLTPQEKRIAQDLYEECNRVTNQLLSLVQTVDYLYIKAADLGAKTPKTFSENAGLRYALLSARAWAWSMAVAFRTLLAEDNVPKAKEG